MEREELIRRRQDIIDRNGPWTAHNIHLGSGVYTLRPEAADDLKLQRVAQIVNDVFGGDLRGRKILDLACLEGGYAIELALQGATTVGIEGRGVSVAKARFAAEALGLSNAEFVEGDVRDLSVGRHGRFDAVLCLGILYHLDAPDVFRFVENIAAVCTRFAIFDTHIGLTGRVHHTHAGHDYRGFTFVEHPADASPATRLRSLWASLDNRTSFWPTRSSLLNLLARTGFSSVYECLVPAEPDKPSDRVTLLAFRGAPAALRALPDAGISDRPLWPERYRPRPHPDQRPLATLRRGLPTPFRRALSRARQLFLREKR